MVFIKKNVFLFEALGFCAVSILGTLLHFLYEWFPSNFTALISGVNESTFEHMKLLFFPMLLFSLTEYCFIGKQYAGYWCIKLAGALLGLALIPIIFYTLRGVFGGTADWVNIMIFFISAAAAFIYEMRQFGKKSPAFISGKWAFSLLLIIALIFFAFTFTPPKIPLFRDPISGNYGV